MKIEYRGKTLEIIFNRSLFEGFSTEDKERVARADSVAYVFFNVDFGQWIGEMQDFFPINLKWREAVIGDVISQWVSQIDWELDTEIEKGA